MKIKYEVPGMKEWHPVLVAGKTRIRIPFTGGYLCSGGNTPACFETSNPALQRLIEDSAPFRSGKIRKAHSVGFEAGPSSGRASAERRATVMKFASMGLAEDFLTREKGVSPIKFTSDEATKRLAESLGIIIEIENTDDV